MTGACQDHQSLNQMSRRETLTRRMSEQLADGFGRVGALRKGGNQPW